MPGWPTPSGAAPENLEVGWPSALSWNSIKHNVLALVDCGVRAVPRCSARAPTAGVLLPPACEGRHIGRAADGTSTCSREHNISVSAMLMVSEVGFTPIRAAHGIREPQSFLAQQDGEGAPAWPFV